MSKTFAIGDIHGNFKALKQCISKSNINKEKDTLIFLGDIVDGWYDVVECVEELLTFKNLIAIQGNHDKWFIDYAQTTYIDVLWFKQGGKNTLAAYAGKQELIDKHLKEYFNKTHFYYVDTMRNYAFMHGGYNWHMPLRMNSTHSIMWDRHMVETAQTWKYEKYDSERNLFRFREFDKIFVGHTTTEHSSDRRYKGSTLPAFLTNLINLDTGAGWNGKLTIMDIDTLDYWQSDLCKDLYPDLINARE